MMTIVVFPRQRKYQYDSTPGILTLQLQNLNIHKASGPDRISTTLLKETAEVTAPIIF